VAGWHTHARCHTGGNSTGPSVPVQSLPPVCAKSMWSRAHLLASLASAAALSAAAFASWRSMMSAWRCTLSSWACKTWQMVTV
jgi:hypothetical protein